MALVVAQTCCLSLLLRGKGDIFWASRLVSGVSSTGEVATSLRTNWTVQGKWADTGDLNGLASFSLHRVTRMPGEPMEGVVTVDESPCEEEGSENEDEEEKDKSCICRL